jgi:hypothetical protein
MRGRVKLRNIRQKLYCKRPWNLCCVRQIFYLATDSPQDEEDVRREEELEVVPASYSSHSLVFLDKFTEYRIQILAFNPAGDGPPSTPITVKTLQVRGTLHCYGSPHCVILASHLEPKTGCRG